MIKLSLVENQPHLIGLHRNEAEALQRFGNQMGSQKSWWGSIREDERERGVIECTPVAGSQWRVTIRNCVGLVRVGEYQLLVEPKIPTDHFLFLLGRSGHLPRLNDARVSAERGVSFWHIMATWFLAEVQKVLRRDLIRDYSECSEESLFLKGHFNPIAVNRNLMVGRLAFDCQFEDFSIDTPRNCTLRTALVQVANSSELSWSLRRTAVRLLASFPETGSLQDGDLDCGIDRRSHHYERSISIARHIIRSQHRSIRHGELSIWSFLIPSPLMIEDGVRDVVKQLCHPVTVRKQGKRIHGKLTFSPDLLFDGGTAVGDVKYKLLSSGALRSDLYQILAFATAFECKVAAVVGFAHTECESDCIHAVGQVAVTTFYWYLDRGPKVAVESLRQQFEKWLSGWARKDAY